MHTLCNQNRDLDYNDIMCFGFYCCFKDVGFSLELVSTAKPLVA